MLCRSLLLLLLLLLPSFCIDEYRCLRFLAVQQLLQFLEENDKP